MQAVELLKLAKKIEAGSRPKGGVGHLSEGIPSLGAEHLDNVGGFAFKKIKYVDNEFFQSLRRGIIHEEDILLVKDGATTGKVSFVGSDFPFKKSAINEHVFRIELDKNVAFSKYVFWYLASAIGNAQIMKDFRGATVGGISRDFASKVFVPLPAIEDQKKIAYILDNAYSLRRKRWESMQLLEEYVQAVFMEMFGDSKSKRWPKRKLAELAREGKGSMRTGPFGSDLKHSEFVDEGVAVIGIDNAVKNRFSWDERRYITYEKYENLKRYTVHPRDVLVTIMGTVGRSAVVPDDVPLAINTKHLVALSLNESVANAQFIAYSIHSDPKILHQIDSKGRGAIMTGLNLGIIKNLEINLPPIELQNDFERIYKTKENLREKMLMQEVEIENQFNALMQKAFA